MRMRDKDRICLSCTLAECDESSRACPFGEKQRARQRTRGKAGRPRKVFNVGDVVQYKGRSGPMWTVVAVNRNRSVDIERRKKVRRFYDYVNVKGEPRKIFNVGDVIRINRRKGPAWTVVAVNDDGSIDVERRKTIRRLQDYRKVE